MVARKLKIASGIAFSLVAVSLLSIKDRQSTGYELSLYNNLPLLFWICISISILLGIAILVHQAFQEHCEGSHWWLLGLSILILSTSVILLLPAFRGYAFYGRGDPMGYLGFAKDLMRQGSASPKDFYPITHIVIAEFAYIAGISAMTTMKYIPTFFYTPRVCALDIPFVHSGAG